jgi:hypothetical protein
MNTLDDYIKSTEHSAIADHIERFLKRGGKIQVLRPGETAHTDGLYGGMGAQIRKNAKSKITYTDAEESE